MAKACGSPLCAVTVDIGGTTYQVGDSVPLPLGTTPAVYTVTDSTGKTSTSLSSITVQGPPTITAPADETLNSTSPAGVSSYTIPQPAAEYCGVPACQVSVLYNGTVYKPGDVIPQLPVGTSTLVYTITDSKGNQATDSMVVTVAGPPEITAPAPANVGTPDPTGASVTLQPPASVECTNPQCLITGVVNGTSYPVGSTVKLPPGTTPLVYQIVDSLGNVANDTTSITVTPLPLYVSTSLSASCVVARMGHSRLLMTYSVRFIARVSSIPCACLAQHETICSSATTLVA